MFKAPFSFKGRIRRLEFGLSYIIFYACLFIFIIAIGFISSDVNQSDDTMLQLVFFLIIIPFYWFLLAQGAKRCHDRGNSGWFQIIPFYMLWMFFADGFPGPNEYGLNPKGIGNHDEISEIGKHLDS